MKRYMLKTVILFPWVFLVWGCQFFNSNNTLETPQEFDSNLKSNLSISYHGAINDAIDLKEDDSSNDIHGPIKFEDIKGIYEGRIDERFIEMTFQKSSSEPYQEALILSDDLINDFSSLDLSQGNEIYIEYYFNENNQKIIFKIENLKE